jgi:hypothetical protein
MRDRVCRSRRVAWIVMLLVPAMTGPTNAQQVPLFESVAGIRISADALTGQRSPTDAPGRS